MRVLNERFATATSTCIDGIKVFDERGWAQVLPDPDEPLVHIYAEGETEEESEELEARVPRAMRRGDHATRRESDAPESVELSS